MQAVVISVAFDLLSGAVLLSVEPVQDEDGGEEDGEAPDPHEHQVDHQHWDLEISHTALH